MQSGLFYYYYYYLKSFFLTRYNIKQLRVLPRYQYLYLRLVILSQYNIYILIWFFLLWIGQRPCFNIGDQSRGRGKGIVKVNELSVHLSFKQSFYFLAKFLTLILPLRDTVSLFGKVVYPSPSLFHFYIDFMFDDIRESVDVQNLFGYTGVTLRFFREIRIYFSFFFFFCIIKYAFCLLYMLQLPLRQFR